MKQSPCDGDASDLLEEERYKGEKLLCDIVMKGGITSGVTYPWAVCEIAGTYRLRNIGGTSAGAIAAATAAAAEFGRQNNAPPGKESRGFVRLGQLPDRLSRPTLESKDSVLFNLFQPSDSTKRYFRILAAVLRGEKDPAPDRVGPAGNQPVGPPKPPAKASPGRMAGAMLRAAVRSAPVGAALGAALGVTSLALLVTLAVTHRELRSDAVVVAAIAVGLLAALIVTLLGGAIGTLVALVRGMLHELADESMGNGFGMCIGSVQPHDGALP